MSRSPAARRRPPGRRPKQTPETILRAASRAYAQDQPTEALRLLRPLMDTELGATDMAALAAILTNLGHPRSAEKTAAANAALDRIGPTVPAADQMIAARAHAFLGQHGRALSHLEAVIAETPGDREAALLAVRLGVDGGDLGTGLGLLEQVIAASPGSVTLLLNAAKILGSAGHDAAALDLLERAGQMDGGQTSEIAFLIAGLKGEATGPQGDMARQIFDGFAETYDDVLGGIHNKGPEIVGALVAKIRPRKGKVLDAGCGTGLCAPHLRPYATHLTGCDISIPMMEKAVARKLYDALTRTDLNEHVTIPAGPFDIVVAADVLTYFGDLTPVFRGLGNRMAPGAWLVFTVEEAVGGPAADRDFAINPSGRFVHRAEGVTAMLARAGFAPPKHLVRDQLRFEFGRPVPGLGVAAQKLAIFG